MAADQAAVDAMRRELNRLPDRRHSGDRGGGARRSPDAVYRRKCRHEATARRWTSPLDPLEGTTICAKNLPNSLAVIALAPEGDLLNAPDSYMDKIAIGPGYPDGLIDLDAPIAENLAAVAKEKGVKINEVTACVLDRPRHARLIEDIRATGAVDPPDRRRRRRRHYPHDRSG
jgi:fructose-1,6-bisphosphatase II / sedoheptulose-1,7-bisphosphatase